MDIEIRTFRPEDLEEVYEIERRSFLWPWSQGVFIHLHHTTPHLFLVAVVDGRVVGYVMGEMEGAKVGHVINIAVHEAYRRRGVGTRLMEELERRFGELGAEGVKLEVREGNEEARAFYRGLGYVERGRVDRYYWNLTAVRMEKKLGR
ncbi:MAG: alanine acetyltransferase [Candidatus Bathyarchaeota archaeon B23]|nr:MAG: alanine acetyltransferase [Candidatus Bathyarchaeota archaeon B23]